MNTKILLKSESITILAVATSLNVNLDTTFEESKAIDIVEATSKE